MARRLTVNLSMAGCWLTQAKEPTAPRSSSTPSPPQVTRPPHDSSYCEQPLDSARIPAAVLPGAELPVSFTVTNDGFAAPFNPRPVFLVLEGRDHQQIEPLPVDANDWAAGKQVTVDGALRLPEDLPAGRCSVAVWMPDQASH